eukprot:5781215-Amphidinium_carterae.1
MENKGIESKLTVVNMHPSEGAVQAVHPYEALSDFKAAMALGNFKLLFSECIGTYICPQPLNHWLPMGPISNKYTNK